MRRYERVKKVTGSIQEWKEIPYSKDLFEDALCRSPLNPNEDYEWEIEEDIVSQGDVERGYSERDIHWDIHHESHITHVRTNEGNFYLITEKDGLRIFKAID